MEMSSGYRRMGSTRSPKPVSSVYRIVRHYGREAGVSDVCSPHKVSHSGVTAYLAMTDGDDFRGAQSYSRHSNLNTLKHYDDNREQLRPSKL